MKSELLVGFVALMTVFFSCSGRRPSNIGAVDGRLRPCPESPNCVSSQAEGVGHFIDPIRYSGDLAGAREKLLRIVRSMKRATVVTEEEGYLCAEYRSALFRFVDDVEFLFDDAKKMIHVRSASRVGYGDMGVNRKRIEKIRELFGGE
ncbi:MAG: DUF1499 domain-containing protein [Chrysiogenales bacterium]|nr:MAG: DUF1499 domain-containing protein [Chrysiogenales bacterium]